ncbi:hypothetical protein L6472_03480 [Prevotella sp. E13-17]|uniref:hypothetical protein n=1 Tax=Prevotella sp. E13-17 TaxID=2913616 RepID=UPI001ED9DC8E|nr:hypothetical protein [Prevotella sp. E13-17]UKK51659.1 hypothetical protein L6472_03480 [Prevotella sp. E13-17]
MKKLLFACAALLMLCACGKREYMAYEGLSLDMPTSQFVDSMKARGLVIDTANTDGVVISLVKPGSKAYNLSIQNNNDTILVIQETFSATTNDSTRQLWQQKRDQYAELYGMPDYKSKGEDRKEAVWKGDKGQLVISLANTYTPTLTVYFDTRLEER